MITADELDLNSYATLIERLLKELSRLPAPLRKKMEAELEELLRLVRDRRPPRFMLIGRRGAGKSTLINAIFGAQVREVGSVTAQTGEAEWQEYERDGKIMQVLDTRGIQEGGKPVEKDEASTPKESILHEVRKCCPDAVLFLCKAKEVDAAIQGDLDIVEEILRETEKIYNRKLPIVGVLTQCDELDPPYSRPLPTNDEEKNQNINTAVEVLRKHLSSREYLRPTLVEVVPTAAYVRYRQDGTKDEKQDYRWNIDYLQGLLLDELPKEAKLDFARLAQVRKFQKKVAANVVNTCAMACGAIGTQPIPAADLPILMTIQLTMVVAVGYISGRTLSLEAGQEFIGALGINVGASFALREIARGLVKLLPGFGDFISGGVAATGTKGLGKAAIAYFLDETPINVVKKQLGLQ